MKITILNGALPGDDFTDNVHNMLAAQLAGPDQPVRNWTLRDEKISFCLGCFECWTKYPGQCRIADTGQDVTASIINSDLVVYLSPVTFGGYSSELKKALDRSIGLILPFFTRIQGEVHHKPRYENFPRLLGIGVLPAPNPEQERIFTSLLERNAINMHATSSAAGFVYRTQDITQVGAELGKLMQKTGWEQPHFVLEGAG